MEAKISFDNDLSYEKDKKRYKKRIGNDDNEWRRIDYIGLVIIFLVIVFVKNVIFPSKRI